MRRLYAGYTWHGNVEHDQIWVKSLRLINHVDAIANYPDDVIVRLQEVSHSFLEGLIIVSDENTRSVQGVLLQLGV